MQPLLSPDLHPDGPLDLSKERPLISVSGGVNSAALLVYLGAVMPPERRPTSIANELFFIMLGCQLIVC